MASDLILHAGMQKTGSTAIQDMLSRASLKSHFYVKWRGSNHSGLFRLLYEEPVEEYRHFKNSGRSREQLLEDRLIWRETLEQQLNEQPGLTGIFSAEDTSACNQSTLRRFADHLAEIGAQVKVVAYVRPPISYIASSFVQGLRGGGITSFQVSRIWPHYRLRLGMLDRVFGRDRVELRRYAREDLVDGDIVADFFAGIDEVPPAKRKGFGNESLTLEATAMLYVQRKFAGGARFGSPARVRANSRFVKLLAGFGQHRFTLQESVVRPAYRKQRADVAWIEKRLGRPMDDLTACSEDGVASKADLVRVARANAAAFDEFVAELPAGETDEVLAYFHDIQNVLARKRRFGWSAGRL